MQARVHAGGGGEETRFSALSRVIGHWVRMVRTQGITREKAWQAVLDYNAAMITPPWPEDRLRREFLALLRRDEVNNGPLPTPGLSKDHPAPPPLSEDGLAAAFVARHGRAWRHVTAWGTWMHWSGTHWLPDETHAIREAIRQVCRSHIAPGTRDSEARRVASERSIRAVECIAAADPAIAVRVADLDAHLFLLNTRSGIVDLKTGELLPHNPARMLTQMTTASLGSSCPRWLRFLDEVTNGEADLVAYLARLCGYCLTGSTEEHVFAFFHGSGANGKSVFLQAVSQVLGSYAATAPLGTFMASRSDAHPTDLAGLVGKRLVTVTETEAGRAWAETRIKTITGGDPLRARFMGRDFFEFLPTFKLAVAGNHRPRLTGVGEAMRRRMHLIPFTVTIAPERRNKRLLEDLLEERDGILAWMIAGHADWRAKNLAPPAAVLQSAEEYFDDEDVVGQWIDACCVQGPTYRATSGDLYRSWKQWADAAGSEPGSQKSLGDSLRERGFISGKAGRECGWIGLAVRRSAPDRGSEE
jgi:putative DNA primase/helicase